MFSDFCNEKKKKIDNKKMDLSERNEFIEFYRDFVLDSLYLCKSRKVRSGILRIVKKIVTKESNGSSLIKSIYLLFEEPIEHADRIDQIFSFVYYLSKIYPNEIDAKKIRNILNNFKFNSNDLKIDLTNYVRLLIKFDVKKQEIERFLIRSTTKPKQIAKFIQFFIPKPDYSQYLASKNIYNSNIAMISFFLLKEKSFSFLIERKTHFRKLSTILVDSLEEYPLLKELFASNCSVWIPLFVNSKETSFSSLAKMIYILIPHENIKSTFHIQSDIKPKKELDEAENESLKAILDALFINFRDFVEKLRKKPEEENRLIDLLSLLKELFLVSKYPIDTSLFMESFSLVLTFTGHFSKVTNSFLDFINKFSLKVPETIIKTLISTNVDSSNFKEFNEFLHYFLPIYEKYPINHNFSIAFISYCVFAPSIYTYKDFDFAIKYFKHLCKSTPNVVKEFCLRRREMWLESNYSAVLILIEELDMKNILLLRHLKSAMNKYQYFSLNELVEKTFKYLKEDIYKVDENFLQSLASNPELDQKNKEICEKMIQRINGEDESEMKI